MVSIGRHFPSTSSDCSWRCCLQEHFLQDLSCLYQLLEVNSALCFKTQSLMIPKLFKCPYSVLKVLSKFVIWDSKAFCQNAAPERLMLQMLLCSCTLQLGFISLKTQLYGCMLLQFICCNRNCHCCVLLRKQLLTQPCTRALVAHRSLQKCWSLQVKQLTLTLFLSPGTGLTHGSCSAITAFGLGGFLHSSCKTLKSILQWAPTDQFLQ